LEPAINEGISSLPPEARKRPSGEKETLRTQPLCSPTQTHFPSSTRHKRTVPSLLPEAMRRPSGEKETLKPNHYASPTQTHFPSSTRHKRTVLSSLPEAMKRPLGEKEILLTPFDAFLPKLNEFLELLPFLGLVQDFFSLLFLCVFQ
jgi:hypothetical protein